MKIIILLTIFLVIIIYSTFMIDYNNRLKLSHNLKIGDKCRIFSTETDFVFVKIIEINNDTATCEHNNGNIESIKLINLIY